MSHQPQLSLIVRAAAHQNFYDEVGERYDKMKEKV